MLAAEREKLAEALKIMKNEIRKKEKEGDSAMLFYIPAKRESFSSLYISIVARFLFVTLIR